MREIVVVGLLQTFNSGDGFVPDSVQVDESDLIEILSGLYGIETDSRGSFGPHRVFGPVRLTIERLDFEEPFDTT